MIKAGMNVSRASYANHPAWVPVKATQTCCTWACHILSKVTPSCNFEKVSVYLQTYSGGKTSACGVCNPEMKRCLLRMEKCSFSVHWGSEFLLPLHRECLFLQRRGGKVLFYAILFGALVRWEWKPLNSISGGKRECGLLCFPLPACHPVTSLPRGPEFCEESNALERGGLSMTATGSLVLLHTQKHHKKG